MLSLPMHTVVDTSNVLVMFTPPLSFLRRAFSLFSTAGYEQGDTTRLSNATVFAMCYDDECLSFVLSFISTDDLEWELETDPGLANDLGMNRIRDYLNSIDH